MSSSDLHVTGLGELQAKLSAMESKTSQKALPLRADAERNPNGEKTARGSPCWDPRTQD